MTKTSPTRYWSYVEQQVLTVVRERLKYHRQYQGFTQAGLAKAAGLTGPYISQLESGSRVPRIEVLIALAEALRITMVEFFLPVPRRDH